MVTPCIKDTRVHADTVLGTQVPTGHTMQPYTDDDRMTNCATNEPHM